MYIYIYDFSEPTGSAVRCSHKVDLILGSMDALARRTKSEEPTLQGPSLRIGTSPQERINPDGLLREPSKWQQRQAGKVQRKSSSCCLC